MRNVGFCPTTLESDMENAQRNSAVTTCIITELSMYIDVQIVW